MRKNYEYPDYEPYGHHLHVRVGSMVLVIEDGEPGDPVLIDGEQRFGQSSEQFGSDEELVVAALAWADPSSYSLSPEDDWEGSYEEWLSEQLSDASWERRDSTRPPYSRY